MKQKELPLVSLNFFIKNRAKMKKLVLIGGAFDFIDMKSINYLKKAASLGNVLVVQISSNNSKHSPRERATIVSAIKYVDYVFIYAGNFFDSEVIEKINPDVILFRKNQYTKMAREQLTDYSGRIVVGRKD